MVEFAHSTILASAGSGKTWQLSTRYLRLLALGASPSRMLASTFTRAAAGEIRDRILKRLAEAASQPKKLAELRQAIDMPRFTRQQAHEVLQRFVREMPAVQIRTLDSFFAAIVRSFSLELGLPRNAVIVDGERAVALRREAIRAMLEATDHDALVEILRQLIEGRSDRGVGSAIDATVRSLHELYREAPREAWEAIDFWPVLNEAEVARAISVLEEAGRTAALPTAHHRNALTKDLERLLACRPDSGHDWAEFLAAGLSKVIAAGGDMLYYKKPVPPELLAPYRRLIHHARGVVRNMVVLRTRATRDLLEKYDLAYDRTHRPRGEFTFADLTGLVTDRAMLDRPDLLSELAFRLDGRIDHLLLDEMQDTSMRQWRALSALAEEILATRPGERTFFCVGDVKQSIYGWREACPELLESLPETYDAIETITLAKSWRSSPVVIDAVNHVFAGVSGNPALENHSETASSWDSGWLAHSTEKEDLAGYVELRTVRRAGDDENQDEARLNEAADLVADLHHRAPHITIGVLTRTNKAAARMVYELGPSRRNIPATARGGGILVDSPPVNAILDAFRLADHPGHSVAAFNVMHSPLGPHLSFTDTGDAQENQHRAVRLSRFIRTLVQERGYAGVIDQWVRAIASSSDARQVRRMHDLIEVAGRFDRERSRTVGGGIRCDEFVRWAEAMASADPPPAPVEIMTIHKSKGLEFDAVVLPDLDVKIADSSKIDVVAARRGASGPITAICRGAKEAVWEQCDDLRELFQSHIGRLARESLCVLYVAMTRAKQGLYMLIDPAKRLASGDLSSNVPKTLAGILASALGNIPIDAETVVYSEGDAKWMEKKQKARPAPAIDRDRIEMPIALSPTTSARASAAAAPSQHVGFGEPHTLGDLLRREPDEAFDRGRAMHALFELIEWIEDGLPGREKCMDAICRTVPRRPREWCEQAVDRFFNCLDDAEIRAILSRNRAMNGRANGELRVWREMRFAREVAGAVQSGAIDRLVARSNGNGGWSSASVIDFKTDEVSRDDCSARAASYEAQVSAYRAAVAEFLRIDRAAVDATLVFVHPRAVLRMD